MSGKVLKVSSRYLLSFLSYRENTGGVIFDLHRCGVKLLLLLWHFRSCTRIPIILWRPSLVVIDRCCHRRRTDMKSGGSFLKHSTWRITCQPVLSLVLDEQIFCKNFDGKWEGHPSVPDRERLLWEGPNFKELFHFLKSNRISLACGLI